MARGERTLRVAELIQREVASTLVAEARDLALRQVTVTGVRVSGDLRHARVLYTSGSAERSEVAVRLRRILPRTAALIGAAVRRLRLTQRAVFVNNGSIDVVARVRAGI